MRHIAALVLVLALGVPGIASSSSILPVDPTPPTRIDDEALMMDTDCLELTGPGEIAPGGILGLGERITLEVQLLIDSATGVDIQQIVDQDERAAATAAYIAEIEAIMAKGQESYEPMNIELVFTQSALLPVRSQEAREATGAAEFIQLGKDFNGGVRPDGVDLVYVAHDIDTGSTVGLADCIGGVELDDRAFATGQLNTFDTVIVLQFSTDTVARTFAHELGHLLGAHHHYQSCGDASLQDSTDDVGPCSLMTNFVNFQTYPASLPNRAVIRGHVEAFAAD